ncbi:hypothetical protein B0H11DRAFT_323404 [Mycena galericulata]|nr:hypothetical protein B0H11DRAFT_323404 [Mycena galericulata]
MSTSEVVAEVAPVGTEDSKAHAEAAPKKEERRKSPSLLAKLLAPFKNEKTKVKKKVKTPKSPKEKKEEQPEAAAPAATAVEEAEPSKEEATAAEAAPEVPTEVPKEEVKEKIDEPTPIAPHLGNPETQTSKSFHTTVKHSGLEF